MALDREFDWKPGRFKDAVLYIAEQLQDDPTFGSTKLNKILYFSDTDAYRELGEPITGAIYQRNRFGPTPVEYKPMIREMEGQNLITVRERLVVDHRQDVIRSTGEFRANTEQFSEAQRRILDARIAEFRGYNNTESSDQSHERSAGWLTYNQGEPMPYRESLISPVPEDVDDEVIAYFDKLEQLTKS
jgi:Antitoxin SocA-like, Panacea domain